MNRFANALLVLFAAVLVAALASAQTVKKGTLSGTVVSATATNPSGGSVVNLLTTPASGSFLITQVCFRGTNGSNNGDNLYIEGSSIGRVANAYESGADASCSTWNPGFALPPGETLSCGQEGASADPGYCTLTGIQSKK